MAKQGAGDLFANQAVITCTESAANTLTFKKLETGISLFEKLAWIIHRIDYYISNRLAAEFNGDGDSLAFALTTTDQLTSLALSNAAVLDWMEWMRADYGTAAAMVPAVSPITKDFASLPGGGLIVPPNPLYLGVKGTGLVAADTVTVKFYYTNRALSPDEYWELVESRRIISS